MQLLRGKFKENGTTGYILKSDYMNDLNGNFDSAQTEWKKLIVTVLSAQQLPKPELQKKGEVIDPYVIVEVLGGPEKQKPQKTSTVNDNGFNPRWNKDNKFEFEIPPPDLGMLHFTCMDKDADADDFLCQYSISLSCCKSGFRHVPLELDSGESISMASLFIHLDFH